jgi:arylsulfatase A-like enzyme
MAVLGFLLPLMLLSRLESFSMFMRPFEILQAFGASWLMHIPIALMAAAVAASCAILLRKTYLGRALPAIVLVSGFLFAVWMGARPWLDARQLLQLSPWFIAALLIAVAVLVGLLRPELEHSARPVAKLLTLGGAMVALISLATGVWPRERPPQPMPDGSRSDILIITMDAFANGHLSSMGYSRPTTPGLDALARTGVQFTHLVASSNYTTPTLNSLLTGRSALAHGAWHLPGRPFERFRENSLPAQLHRIGYAVRAVTTNPNGGIYKNGYSRWFETIVPDAVPHFTGCRDDLSRWLAHACAGADLGVVKPLALRVNFLLDWAGWWKRGRHVDIRIALDAADRLFRRGPDGRPVAVWVHISAPHDPYVAPRPFLGRFAPSDRLRNYLTSTVPYQFAFAAHSADQALFQARYDESIAAVDADVTDFVARLQRAERLDRAILMVSADHGESFTPDYGGHAGPKLHDALIRVPLILKAPGLPAGLRITMPVSQIDLAPTLLALAGGSRQQSGMEGRSLLPVIAGTAASIPVYAFALERSNRNAEPQVGTAAMIDGQWKYVHYWNQPDLPGYRDLVDGLYDQSADPGERHNLIEQEPRRAAAMLGSIRRKIATDHPGGPAA